MADGNDARDRVALTDRTLQSPNRALAREIRKVLAGRLYRRSLQLRTHRQRFGGNREAARAKSVAVALRGVLELWWSVL